MRQVIENGLPVICDTCRDETWRPVFGDHGASYEVSSLGRVRRVGGLRPLSARLNSGGYLQVQLFAGGKRTWRKVHRLVAEVFLGARPAGATINHVDGVRTNNAAGNLEYVSQAENNRHSWRVNRSKLTFLGEKMGVPEAVERFGAAGVHTNMVWSRLAKGWDPDRAVTTPAMPTGRPKCR